MHVPVLLSESLEALAIEPGGVYCDGTLGLAGHAAEILKRAGAGGRLLGIDKDSVALKEAARRLEHIAGEKKLVHGGHGDIRRIAADNGFSELDGILLDLGVSSFQLDTPERGFSFQRDGKLSMLMDADAESAGAAELLAKSDERELTELFRRYGEEPRARRIAEAIIKARESAAIETTVQLADIVSAAVGRSGAKHPATRVFQALRMAVNSELEELEQALEDGLWLLKPGGRMAVITFESLSDRIVKRHFANHAGRWVSLQQGGECWEGELPPVERVTRKPVKAGTCELRNNPRARSAKLRVVKRVAEPHKNKANRY
ncbi:MAG: 16S rRNA (cytosine(1402)-N(4))-methyltransferase RsmH [Kiritimatiellae bacterium]|nr:16S rRNA (cytosine(1402)-N(4))-methyltransferase RsmH [Kiritimatiellia bacterium]